MSEGNSDDLQPVGAKGNEEERRERVNCNGEILRTSEPLKGGSTSETIDHKGSPKTSSSEVCSSVDNHWEEDEQTAPNSKKPSQNNHNSDSSSSEDDPEMEGQGDFAANWYVPLPQDPQESDEEVGGEREGSEQWSEAGAGGTLQTQQDEEVDERQDASIRRVEEVKAASQMEDSQVEAIKQAMAGFSLPLGSQPQWARMVPENVWKAELIGGLQQKQRHKSKAKTKQKKT